MPTLAIISAGPHTAESLRAGLEADGFETVTAGLAEIRTGELDLVSFLEEHDPEVIVYQVGTPYPQSLTFLRLLQDTAAARHRGWVLTAADPAVVADLLDGAAMVPEVTAPDAVAAAVRRALAGRGRRPAAAA